jgi:Na+-transporting NADH:ubiquinone oxidoreductase subunit NqrC
MRFVATTLVVYAFALTLAPTPAFAVDDRLIDAQAMAALMLKADQAQPKEQCFLYAEIVHQMTELAGKEYSAGDNDNASATLAQIQKYAEKIHMGVANDAKKVKNAEELMRHTSVRLTGILNSASYEDREILQSTLKQLEQVHTELMMQVFKK